MKLSLCLLFGLFLLSFSLCGQNVINQSPNSTVCAGNNVTFIYTGSCPTVQWQLDAGATPVSSVTTYPNASITVHWNSPTSTASVTARCSSNLSLTGSTGNFVVNSTTTPSVSITGPTSICLNSPVTFQATPVNGGNAPTYTWQINGAGVSGASSSSFTTTQLAQGSVVTVSMISNAPCAPVGAVTSNAITISTATSPPAVSIFVNSPSPLCPGQTTATFSTIGSNQGDSPTFIWYRNGSPATDNLSSGGTYIPQNALNDQDKIKCQVTSSLSCVSNNPAMSSEVTVSFQPPPTLSINMLNPQMNGPCQGDVLSFSATSNYPISTYSWSIDGGNLPNSNAIYTVSNLSASTHTINLSVGLSGCSGTTGPPASFSITVNPKPSVGITGPTSICLGSPATFQATPVNGGNSLTYAWQINGANVSGATSSSFSPSQLALGDAVSVIMTPSTTCDMLNTVTSNAITISTATSPSPVSIFVNSPSPLCPGQTTATFSTIGSNQGDSPTFIWYRNGSPATDNLSSGGTYIPQNALNDQDKIKCQVTSSLSCVSNNPAMSSEVTVSFQPQPTLSINPVNPILNVPCQGAVLSFSATSNYPISTYSWSIDGSPPSPEAIYNISNLTASSHTINLSAGLTSCSLSASASYNVTVNANPSAAISPFGSLEICSYCSQLILAPSGNGYTYQWENDGTAIPYPGGQSNTYVTTAAGVYSVVVTSGGCSVGSSTLTLTKNIAPVVSAGPDQAITLPTNSIVLQGSGSDADGTISSYLWTQLSGSPSTLSGATSSTLSVTGLSYGANSFLLTVTDNFGESASAGVIVQVNYPPGNYNYVRESSVNVSGETSVGDLTGLPVEQVNIHNSYFDGLGRPMQSVSQQASPLKADFVQPIAYDAFGRESVKYLPYTSAQTSGDYTTTALSDQNNYYQSTAKTAVDSQPFSQTVFELSPLNRAAKQGAPGTNWQPDGNINSTSDHTVKHHYEINNGATDVILFTYDPTTGLVSTGAGSTPTYYGANQLEANRTTDEHQNDVIEYVDKLGRTVCKKVQSGTNGNVKVYASTYYIYDDLGSLVVVLPPEAINSALSSLTKN